MSAVPLVLFAAIQPTTEADAVRLAEGLRKVTAEDPGFRIDREEQTGRMVLRAADVQQLEAILERLKREFHVAAAVGSFQVAYKEALTRTAEGEGRYVDPTAGRKQYGHVKIRLLPGAQGTGYLFESHLAGGWIPETLIRAVDSGIQKAGERGVLAGYPLDDFRAELYDASFHETDSTEMSFQRAGHLAFEDAAAKAGAVLLEPVMAVEISVPTGAAADVIGDWTARRGRIGRMEQRGTGQFIIGAAPLAEILGYTNELRALTAGQGAYLSKFLRYEPVPLGGEDDPDRVAPVCSPLAPRPKGKSSVVGLPEPVD